MINEGGWGGNFQFVSGCAQTFLGNSFGNLHKKYIFLRLVIFLNVLYPNYSTSSDIYNVFIKMTNYETKKNDIL